VHLLAEISAKRENFFEAAGALAECRASLRDTCDSITMLRQRVRSLVLNQWQTSPASLAPHGPAGHTYTGTAGHLCKTPTSARRQQLHWHANEKIASFNPPCCYGRSEPWRQRQGMQYSSWRG
jgi:hypothetical protein